jgi:hypothetical protein
MDEVRGALEDLPPLTVREVRRLDLREPPAEGRPAHISSASGVWRRGQHLYVIGDELHVLAHFRSGSPDPGEVHQVLHDEGRGKPDLEALTVLPPAHGKPFGTLVGLGSGSAPGRDRGFAWALGPDGDLEGEPRTLDLAPLYDRLRDELGSLDVEGACVMGERLWVLHRGDAPGATPAIAELPLDEVARSVDGDGRLDARELVALRSYELGELDGVRLTFSDATPLGDGQLVFTASAEDSEHAIHGSVVGTIDLDGSVRRLRTIDREFKVEGVHGSVDTGVLDLLLVCDQDDDQPSPLLAAAMPLDAALDRAVSS